MHPDASVRAVTCCDQRHSHRILTPCSAAGGEHCGCGHGAAVRLLPAHAALPADRARRHGARAAGPPRAAAPPPPLRGTCMRMCGERGDKPGSKPGLCLCATVLQAECLINNTCRAATFLKRSLSGQLAQSCTGPHECMRMQRCACGRATPAARRKRVCRAAPPRAQEFHNYNPATDIFCHSNRLFWDVTCPGIVDGFGGVMCTGTNYVVRSRALLKARPGRMLCSAARCVWPRVAACLPHRGPYGRRTPQQRHTLLAAAGSLLWRAAAWEPGLAR